ncbi:MAG: hypothetical protein OEY88_08575 [Candidatus Bathyarchaeota archaeon]|nr:hypothetical protein [Candidatus Bathyarchaeota archaeon]
MLQKKVEYLEENGKRKEMEIQRLRVQAEENVDLKGCVKQTEEKLGETEQTLKELTKLIAENLKD